MTNILRERSGSISDEEEGIRLVESPDLDPDMPNNSPIPTIHIHRPIINQISIYPKLSINSDQQNQRNDSSHNRGNICNRIKTKSFKILLSLIPILNWLPKYEWKKDISYDMVAGFTIAVMHIPQGMAYALLGNLPPIIGLYMGFFPVIIYALLGTSKHISMGTFAVICLMAGKTTMDQLIFEISSNRTEEEGGSGFVIDYDELMEDDNIKIRMIQIATILSFAVGMWQLVMGIFRLGSLSLLLNSDLVSGFTTGAAIHVLTSQMKNLLGIGIPRRSGIFKIILTYIDIFRDFLNINIPSLIMSSITLILLIGYNEGIKPFLSQKIPFPIPIELITIIVGTIVSKYGNFHSKYNVSIVSTIPTGLPNPELPPFNILNGLLLDGFIIAVVSYAISISMAKIFANKHKYIVDPNQELIAQGGSNIIGSFFSCAPIAASLSRSVIQDSVGGRTQLASLFSCSILLFVLLWIGPFFETLPNCILSGIIIVALKGMFLQFNDFYKSFKISKINGGVWMLTFLGTVLLDIEYGLGIGISLSLLILIYTSTNSQLEVLGNINQDIYAQIKDNIQAKEIHGLKILKYVGSLNFVNSEKFVKGVEKELKGSIDLYDEIYQNQILINSKSEKEERGDSPISIHTSIDYCIFDFGSLTYVDPGSLESLTNLSLKYKQENIQFLFCSTPISVLRLMDQSQFITNIGIINFFPTVHDAVVYATNSINQPSSLSHHN